MKSIEQAIFWETAVRGKWWIPGLFLVSLLIPFLVYSILSSVTNSTASLAEQPEFRTLYFGFLPPILVQCAFGIVLAQGTLSRLYDSPISTLRLVAAHFFPGGLLLAVQTAIASSLFNSMYHADWPVLGSSMIAFAAWGSAQMLIHVSRRTLGSTLILMMPIIGIILWLPIRYGERSYLGLQASTNVSLVDVGFMLLSVAASFVLTVLAVGRDRCGEKLPGVGDWSWIDRIFEHLLAQRPWRSKRFLSPSSAHQWFESCTRGRAYVASNILILLILGLGWTTSIWMDQNTRPIWTELKTGLWVYGWLQCVVAASVGFILGVLSWTSDASPASASVSNLRLGPFVATLPLSNTQMAVATLQAVAHAIIKQWVIWIVLLAMAFALDARNPVSSPIAIRDLGIGWGLYFLASLLGPWIILGNIVVMSLTGRFLQFFLGCVVASLSTLVCLKTVEAFGSDGALQVVHRGMAVGYMIALTWLLSIVLVKAWSRRLIGPRVMAGMVVVALTTLAGTILFQPDGDPWILYPCMITFAMLVILPIGTAPLALAWNRHQG